MSGAGDTVAAALAVTLAAGADWETALRMANAAAAVAVGKKRHRDRHARRNCAARSCRMPSSRPKKRSSRSAPTSTRSLRSGAQQGLRIGFTNGCFDILHPGHVKVLTAARARLRPADRRPQQRCLGEAAEGREPPGAERARPRRSAGGARGGRSRRDLRRGHAARADHRRSSRACWSRAATTPASRWSAMRSSTPMAARWCWSISCRASARRRWSIARADGGGMRADMWLSARLSRHARSCLDRSAI